MQPEMGMLTIGQETEPPTERLGMSLTTNTTLDKAVLKAYLSSLSTAKLREWALLVSEELATRVTQAACVGVGAFQRPPQSR